MKNIFLIHGAYGNPKNNWFPWLQQQLENEKFRVFVPKFPTPERQNLREWMEVFGDYFQYIDENTILIGHSIGATFILNILEKLDHPIKACLLVSGFLGLLNNPQFDTINETISNRTFNWNKIRQNCQHFEIYHSDNDPYVPYQKAVEIGEKLNTTVTLIPKAGHFNTEAGWLEFPQILKKIKNC